MIKLKIEKNHPIPNQKIRVNSDLIQEYKDYDFEQIKVGESFTLNVAQMPLHTMKYIVSHWNNFVDEDNQPYKFITRGIDKDGKTLNTKESRQKGRVKFVRVWRVK